MIRVLTVLIIVFCRYSITASAMELPLIPHGSALSVLDGLRQNALEDWKQGRLEKAVDCYRDILRAAEASPGKEFAEDLRSFIATWGATKKPRKIITANWKRFSTREIKSLPG
jgi:hypothetical protein